MENLITEIKTLLISSLNLEDIQPDDIDTNLPLFVDGLGLDSIDALELGVALQRRYGLNLSSDSAETRQHFSSISALAAFVVVNRTK